MNLCCLDFLQMLQFPDSDKASAAKQTDSNRTSKSKVTQVTEKEDIDAVMRRRARQARQMKKAVLFCKGVSRNLMR